MKRTLKVHTSRADYIDPGGCESIVAYAIVSRLNSRRRRFSANMDLSDCNRKINWYFSSDADGLKKIDKVIEIMTNFRSEFVRAQKEIGRRKVRLKHFIKTP
jgi:hypothetical protein